eukprot:s9008_g1.t1
MTVSEPGSAGQCELQVEGARTFTEPSGKLGGTAPQARPFLFGPENVDSKAATAKMEQSIAALSKMWGFGGHKDKSTDHKGKKENPLKAAQKAMAKAEHSMMAAFKDLTPPKGAAAGSQSQLTNSRPNVQSADKSFVSASEWKKQQKTMNAALDKALEPQT